MKVKVELATSTSGLEARMVRMVVVSRCAVMESKEDLTEDSRWFPRVGRQHGWDGW